MDLAKVFDDLTWDNVVIENGVLTIKLKLELIK